MSTHNIGFEVILMSTHNIGFYEEIAKLSLNYHQIRTLFLLLTQQKKIRNSKISPLSSPFNAKMLIVIKYLFLIKSYLNKCKIDKYLCPPCV